MMGSGECSYGDSYSNGMISKSIGCLLDEETHTTAIVQERMAALCKEVVSQSHSSQSLPYIIQKIFLDPQLDLFSFPDPIVTQMPQESLTLLLYAVVGGNGILLEGAWSHPVVAQQLFSSLRIHADKSGGLRDSLGSRCVSEWSEKLLPQESFQSSSPSPSTLHTPLELFLPQCSFLLSVPPESEDAFAVKGAHLICQLINELCNTQQFPSANRLHILRFVLRQVHTFCLSESSEVHLASLKKALHLRAPFVSSLFTFLLTSIQQCTSIQSFQNIFAVWLTFVRPWRYVGDERIVNDYVHNVSPTRPTLSDYSSYFSFVDAHEKFYSLLLGKILKKLRQLELSHESSRVIRMAVECSFRPGLHDALVHLQVDARPAVTALLDQLALISHKDNSLSHFPQEEFSSFQTSTNYFSLSQAKEEIRVILRDACEQFGYTIVQSSPRVSSPSKGLLPPDSYTDERTGLVMLTPLGRLQVVSGERSFDFCPSSRMASPSRCSRLLSTPILRPLILSPCIAPSPVPLFTRFIPHYDTVLRPHVAQSLIIICILVLTSLLIHPSIFILTAAYLYLLYSQGLSVDSP